MHEHYKRAAFKFPKNIADIREDCVLVLFKANPQALFPSEQS